MKREIIKSDMTIHEFAAFYRVSVKKLRQMQFNGHANFGISGSQSDTIVRMRSRLKRGQSLTVENLIMLANGVVQYEELDAYARRARKQVNALGPIAVDALPVDRRSWINGSAIKDGMACKLLSEWIASVIPEAGCDYHYIAVRIMWNIPDQNFKAVYAVVARAVMNCRHASALDGMSETINGRTKFFKKSPLIYDL